jgi:diacylglycerol kinase family enzyme
VSDGGIEVLLNERAGSTGDDTAARITTAFTKAGADVRVVARPGGELAAAAATAARQGRTIVAAGGDGTVSAVAAVAVEHAATFGVIPLGTLNHFAKDAGIPLDLEAAVATIVTGRGDRLDVAEANGHIFVNNASAGFYARIVRERQLEQQRGHGKWTAFALGLARAMYDYRPLTVRLTIDGDTRSLVTPFVFVGNGDYVTEGLDVGRRCSIANGRLSVYVAPECRRADMLTMVLRALAGRMTDDVRLQEFRAREVTIDPRSRRAPLAADGELLALPAPVRCTVRPGALRTLRPAVASGS